jgi:hypothetical protein
VEGAGLIITASGFGVDIPLNPGRYVFSVSAVGFDAVSYEVEVGEGQRRTLAVELGARTTPVQHDGMMLRRSATPSLEMPATSPAILEPAPRDRSSTLRTAGTITLGVAASSLIVSLVAGYATIRNKQTLETICPKQDECPPAGMSVAESADTIAVLATATFASSIALAAGGVTLLLVAGSSGERASTGSGSRGTILHAALSGALP